MIVIVGIALIVAAAWFWGTVLTEAELGERPNTET